MTTLTRILAAVDQLRQQLQDVRLDHPWDQNVRRNSLARLDALRSDLSVAEKRQGEDQPRVTYDPATDQAVPVDNDESLRAPVVSRTTTDDATVIDREDGTRTTIGLDGSVAIEQRPVTESLMRAAQVGWVVRTVGGHVGKVEENEAATLYVDLPNRNYAYLHEDCGQIKPRVLSDYDIVSLAPPEVQNDVKEVMK